MSLFLVLPQPARAQLACSQSGATGASMTSCSPAGADGLIITANPDSFMPNESLVLRGGGSGQAVRNYLVGNADNPNQSNVWIGDAGQTASTTTIYANHLVVGDSTTVASGTNAAAIGAGAAATQTNALAFGAGSRAEATGAVALGAGSVADQANTVSIGAAGAERRIVNVAAGNVAAGSTDAVTGNQLYITNQAVDALDQRVTQVDTRVTAVDNRVAALDDSVLKYDGATYNATRGGVATRLSGVAGGVMATDAVNLQQLTGSAQSVAAALGGGAGVDASGQVTAPSYALSSGTYNNVGSALTGIDNRMTALDDAALKFDGTTYNAQRNGAATRISNVADGVDTYDAANVGQLDRLEQRVGARTRYLSFGQAAGAGQDSMATGLNAVAIGQDAMAGGDHATALGGGAHAHVDGSTAMGSEAHAMATDSTAVGAGARATAQGAVAIGAGSLADQGGTVSVGAVGAERRIVNVAPGVDSTDAVNMAQLNAVDGRVDALSSDVSLLTSRVTKTGRLLRGGIAATAALVQTGMAPPRPGGVMLNAGIAHYEGATALAVGLAGLSENGRIAYSVGLGWAIQQRGPVVRAGVGFMLN